MVGILAFFSTCPFSDPDAGSQNSASKRLWLAWPGTGRYLAFLARTYPIHSASNAR
jgi:hypothetical protein